MKAYAKCDKCGVTEEITDFYGGGAIKPAAWSQVVMLDATPERNCAPRTTFEVAVCPKCAPKFMAIVKRAVGK